MKKAALSLALLLNACATVPQGSPDASWRSAATEDDRGRLRDWRSAFAKALAQAAQGGASDKVAREGPLLQPDAALGPVPIPNGSYKCRVLKLGSKSEGMPSYTPYPAYDCTIRQDGAVQQFTKLTGSQRHVGTIYPDSAIRQAFLGTLVLGDEDRAMQYGRDPDRDVAGWVERVGPTRWRLVLPYPRFESTLDVIELVPAP